LLAGIAGRCTEVAGGARNIDHILTRTLLPEMSAEFLARMAEGRAITSVRVGMSPEGAFQYEFS
jgi:type VI secretion system protein VasG